MAVDPLREYVASKIARYEKVVVHAPDRHGRLRRRFKWQKVKDGWTPLEAIDQAKVMEAEDTFMHCALLVALCQDEKARAHPDHNLIHVLSGVMGCCGPAMLDATATSLGISDERARYLVDHLQERWNMTQGLLGGGA